MTAEPIRSGIVALIANQCPDASEIEVADLRQLHGGNSSEIWSLEVRWSENGAIFERSLILRRAAGNEFGSAGRAAEYALLEALEPTDLPTPDAYWLDAEGRFLERPAMLVARLPGSADRRLLQEDNRFGLGSDARLRLARDIAALLAAVHRIDPAALSLPAGMRSAGHPALEQLRFYDAEIARQEVEPSPELRLASLWLHERLPLPPPRTALVHGDWRPANLLVSDARIVGVLDWEFAHQGDPAEDLGWYLASIYVGEHLISGCWSTCDFLEGYEAAGGSRVDPAALRFWSVFALYKLASMTVAAMGAFAAGDRSRMAPSADFILRPLLQNLLEEQPR